MKKRLEYLFRVSVSLFIVWLVVLGVSQTGYSVDLRKELFLLTSSVLFSLFLVLVSIEKRKVIRGGIFKTSDIFWNKVILSDKSAFFPSVFLLAEKLFVFVLFVASVVSIFVQEELFIVCMLPVLAFWTAFLRIYKLPERSTFILSAIFVILTYIFYITKEPVMSEKSASLLCFLLLYGGTVSILKFRKKIADDF